MLYMYRSKMVVTQPIRSLSSSKSRLVELHLSPCFLSINNDLNMVYFTSHMLDSSACKELQFKNPSAGWNLITNSLLHTTSPTTTSKINILQRLPSPNTSTFYVTTLV